MGAAHTAPGARRWAAAPAWIAGLLLGLFPVLAAAAGEGPSEAQARAHLAEALAWVETHPATPEDGGPMDLVDEAVLYLVLRDHASASATSERYARALARRLEALDALPAFLAWVERPDHDLFRDYHLVLAARLMRLAGMASAHEAAIVRKALRDLRASPRAHPCLRLTVGVLLGRLGAFPEEDLRPLLRASLIEWLARGGRITLPEQASGRAGEGAALNLYALVHELVTLTEFGRRPPSPWLAARREPVLRALLAGARWASREGRLDLLAELAVSMQFLGPDPRAHALLRRAAQLLIARQRPDGAWGASPTTRRPNRVRHTVLTGAGLLLVYANGWERPRDGGSGE